MKNAEASQKYCPFMYAGIQSIANESQGYVMLCEVGKCMAWHQTSETEGYCSLIEKSKGKETVNIVFDPSEDFKEIVGGSEELIMSKMREIDNEQS